MVNLSLYIHKTDKRKPDEFSKRLEKEARKLVSTSSKISVITAYRKACSVLGYSWIGGEYDGAHHNIRIGIDPPQKEVTRLS